MGGGLAKVGAEMELTMIRKEKASASARVKVKVAKIVRQRARESRNT